MRYLCKMYNVHKVPVGTRHTKDNLQVVVRDCPEIKLFYTDADRVILYIIEELSVSLFLHQIPVGS